MNNILDKQFTIRQMLRWLSYASFLIVPLFLAAVFLNSWHIKMGGVTLATSPIKDKIPAQCNGFVERSSGNTDRTLANAFLLRDRRHTYYLDKLINSDSPAIPCLGYAVLGGLHSKTASDANFIEEYINADGATVVTVHVKYGELNRPFF